MSNLILNRLKQKPRGEVAADGTNLENEDEEEAAPEEDEAVPEGPEDLELPAAQVNRPYHVKDWSQSVMVRYPRPVSAPYLPFFFNDTATTDIYTLSLHAVRP